MSELGDPGWSVSGPLARWMEILMYGDCWIRTNTAHVDRVFGSPSSVDGKWTIYGSSSNLRKDDETGPFAGILRHTPTSGGFDGCSKQTRRQSIKSVINIQQKALNGVPEIPR